MASKIVQVPMDDTLKAALDEVAEEEGRSRADLIRQACEALLHRRQVEAWDRRQQEAYRRVPDTEDSGLTQLAVIAEVLPDDDWSDVYPEFLPNHADAGPAK